jgi:5-methylcytosine-specific restriction endonuclease McrA
MSASIKQSGENNSIFRNPNWKEHIMENGLKTRELYRGSRSNKSPKWVRQFSPKQDVTMLRRCNHTCEHCKTVKHGLENPLESDHILANKLGGKTKIENGQMLCKACHVIKTREDKRLIREKFNQGIVRTLQ